MIGSPGVTAPALASAVAEDLRMAFGRLKRRLLAQAHPGDFTLAEKSVIVHLEREGPATVSNLAKVNGVRPQSMGATVAALAAAGLVRGKPDPADGRQTLFFLTAACRRRLKAGRAARQDWLSRAIQTRLSSREQKELARAVALLHRLADS